MLPGIRNADGGDASSVFTRLLRVFSRRRSEPPRRVCKPRIYGPSTLEDEDVTLGFPDGTDQFEMRSELLARIQICYQRVKIRDAAGGGFCFGLLDPLSNIIANTFIDMAVVETEEEVKEEEEDDDASTWHGQTDEIPGDMNQRSLNGLITFLAVLFPHLSDAQAVWYLHKAEAHPLVAARIIIKHRRMDQSFGFGSDATAAAVEAALCCAAAAARHPNPKRFLTGWRLLSPSMKKLAAVLSPSGGPSVVTSSELLASFPTMEPPHPSAGFDLRGSWELATSRLLSLSPDLGRVVFPGRTTMRRMLLTTIHGYYLQALARLPRDQLCSQSQHLLYSMLHYGHCFGPLDPVSNIVFNTIWYSSACPQPLPPPKENAEMDAMVSTSALLRIAVRSFYGLVSFLCTRYDTLTVDQAMHDLLVAGADLRIADPNFHGNHAAAGRCPSASIEEAYAAAAAAALHPKPESQCVLLRQSALILRMGSIYLNGGGPLSCEVAYRLSSTAQHLSSSYFQAQLMPETMVLDRLTYARVNQQRKNFWNQHARVVRMVKSAMDMYNSQPGVPKYELHVICGVNEKVHGPEYITGNSQRYQHSHINFLATCKDSQSAGALPVLFFAQWSNDGSKDECFCCPVGVPPLNSEQIRCFYCEYEGSRIVHPANESFHGRYIEFGKMLGGGLYAGNYTNNYIIEQSCSLAFWVGELEDDSIYSISRIAADDKEDRLPPVSFHRLIRLT